MRYIQLLSSVLVLCFALTVSAYAAEPATVDPPTNIPENVPEWALRPALEPGEEPTDETDTGTADDSASERGYTTIYNSDGTIRYTDDPALLADPSLFAAADETDSPHPRKPFAPGQRRQRPGKFGKKPRGATLGRKAYSESR